MDESIYKDAMRYRWLRDTNAAPFRMWGDDECRNVEVGMIDALWVCNGVESNDCTSSFSPDPMDIDAYIDAAMERWPNSHALPE